MNHEWIKGEYRVSTDRALLDMDVIHGFLTRSYWSPGIPRGTVERAVRHSLPFGLYHGETQIGFARVITDRATFAYLADVFVLEGHRGAGLGKFLVGSIMSHPWLGGLRRFMLGTRDAHGLYSQFGFTPVPHPERLMARMDPDVYRKNKAGREE